MPKIAALGGLSSRGFGEFAQQTAANYIEDVFSTYLYTGNGSTQTITNGIDLSGKGGLVWLKSRSASTDHALYDTARGATFDLVSNSTAAQTTQSTGLTAFLSSGFTIGSLAKINTNAATYVSWTFAKQPKFFDIITYTGNGVAGRTVNHNLGSVPGMIIVKCTNTGSTPWPVYHRSIGSTGYVALNTTGASGTYTYWNNTSPTDTVFSLGSDADVNASGQTYVAYLFAHNAGGFGADGSQNVISCGSFTTNASGKATVNLGWEPQYVFVKNITSTGNWLTFDNMRGFANSVGASNYLILDLSAKEYDYGGVYFNPTALGFYAEALGDTQTYIYMAIRRGPMKTPTDATKVFNAVAYTGNGSTRTFSVGFPTDLAFNMNRGGAGDSITVNDRLRGSGKELYTNSTDVEYNAGINGTQFDNQLNIVVQNYRITNSTNYINWLLRRAPGFFDVICYSGAATAQNINHNLGVVPEMMLVKCRTFGVYWAVYHSALGPTKFIQLNSVNAPSTSPVWNNTAPTNSVFTVNNYSETGGSGDSYIAYLFASCPGVSKVGSYTGTGATQTINCGFTGGARYVLIRRTDSSGSWWVWDTARGMVAGTDPRLAYNSTAAETNADWVYTTTGGFQIVTSDATVNANGGSYIYLAIA